MRHLLLTCLLALTVPAGAHPLGKTSHSLYSALRVGDGTVSAVVILEVPRDVVLEDVRARIDGGVAKRKAVKEHDAGRFAALAEGLSLKVDGEPVPVVWRPLAVPSNGKVVDDFFMYWVGAEVPLPDGQKVEVKLDNQAFQGVDMVYSGSVQARGAWKVDGNSVAKVLGADPSTLDRTDPAAWTTDASLRAVAGSWTRR